MNARVPVVFLFAFIAAAGPSVVAAQPLAYDTSAWELSPAWPRDPAPWARADLARTLAARTGQQKVRRELDVDYYRIGHTLAFRLPVAQRPTRRDLPPGIATMSYPWVIWLSWEMEERWRILHDAWRGHGDVEAGRILQQELAALATWDHFVETSEQVGLVTGHLAGCLALALADPGGWDHALLAQARRAADALLERDVAPWFQKQWAGKPVTSARLANIPVIALARAAELARVRGHASAAELDTKMIELLRAWVRFRNGREFHTEGTTYDGYLMDSVTGWLATHPQRAALLQECEPAFRSLADAWIHLTLPGRADLHAPIGDVEPEMPFWNTVLVRFAGWYRWPDVAWLLTRVPVTRLPAAALVEAATLPLVAAAPASGPREHPHAVSLRTGWAAADFAAIISAPRNAMGHLQADAGQVVLGWQGRFWITDPGYQQYRPGEEREYTLGPPAHNAPVINGTVQKPRAARVVTVETDARGRQHTEVDLAACYPGLPAGATVTRDVWLARSGAAAVIVRDRLGGLPPDAEIATHWLGGHRLAWAFVNGWARLSDGRRAVWIGTSRGSLAPADLTRHPGTRGPLTLVHRQRLAGQAGAGWWILWCDETGGWVPPAFLANGGRLQVKGPGATEPWVFGEER